MTTKQRLTILAAFFILMTSCSSKQIREEKFNNGNPKEKYEVSEKKDGSFLKDGYFKQWFENGQLSISGNYKDNKENGKWTSFYNTGKIEEEGSYENGQKAGIWKQFAENGQVLRELTFKAGELNGLQKWWFSGGQKHREATYENDKLNGTQITWNEDGSIKTKFVFEYGKNITIVGTWYYTRIESGNASYDSSQTYTYLKDGTLIKTNKTTGQTTQGTYKFESENKLIVNDWENEILSMTDAESKLKWPSDGSIFIGRKLK